MLPKPIRRWYRLVFVLLLNLIVRFVVAKPVLYDSVTTVRLEKLARQMRIKEPKLLSGNYQVRLWIKVELIFGDAQSLYVLDKRRNKLLLTQYSIHSDTNHTYRGHTLVKEGISADVNLWQELVDNDVLTLPDQSSLQDQLFPKQPKDSSTLR